MATVTGAPTAPAADLIGFRQAFYGTLGRWADALFELTDARLEASAPVASTPHLKPGSLFPPVARVAVQGAGQRQHQPDRATRTAGRSPSGGLRCSPWTPRPQDRCEAECSPQRGFYYHPSKHSAGQPIVAGWSYQWIAQLSDDADSWTAPLDARRIPVDADVTDATVEQICELLPLLGHDYGGLAPLFVFDAGYDPIGLTHTLVDEPVQLLVRIRDDRVFCTDPPQRPEGTTGRPRRHGEKFRCSDAATWPDPDQQLTDHDELYGTVTVTAWSGLHPKLGRRGRFADHEQPLPTVRGTVIRVEVEHLPRPTARTKKSLWLWWAGPDTPDLELCFRAYLRRFDLEHTYRFVENTLGWTTPKVCTPDQVDRWTWLIVAGYTQLRLARGLVDDLRLPWERPRNPDQLTPARVRRGFRRLAAHLGTPANPPNSRTPGPRRPKGSPTGPRTRHPAIKKAAA